MRYSQPQILTTNIAMRLIMSTPKNSGLIDNGDANHTVQTAYEADE